MNRTFTRKELQEQIGFNTEETKIIMEYQKRLPILIENDEVDGFCVNARDLWRQLEVDRQFSKWISDSIAKGSFTESKDYSSEFFQNGHVVKIDYVNLSQQKMARNGITIEYHITLDMAKQIAMFAGTHKNSNEALRKNSQLARQYFILMEKAVRQNIDWLKVRHPEKEGYIKLCSALDKYIYEKSGRNADKWDYSAEADAINIICTGLKAQSIRNHLGILNGSDLTRDSLTKQYNEYLLKMQEMDIVYLGMQMDRCQRYEMLNQTFNILFPNAVSLVENISTSEILDNKTKFLKEVKDKYGKVA